MKLNEENKVNDDNAQNLCCHLSFYCSGINRFLLREKMNFHFLSIFIPSQQCFSFLILLLFISFIFRCFFYGFLYSIHLFCALKTLLFHVLLLRMLQHIFNDLYHVCVVKKLPILRFFFAFQLQ